MEDENGIELSLGLSCGGSAGKSKTKDGSSAPTPEEGDNSKPMTGNLNCGEGTFKHFFNSGAEKQDQSGQPRSDPKDNFWTELKRVAGQGVDVSTDPHDNSSHFTRYHQELWQDTSANKRKSSFEETQQQKKQELETEHIGLAVKNHVSVTTDDGSSAENEDVAESEAEGSTSRLVSPHDESTKQYMGGGSSITKFKDKREFIDSSFKEPQGQKQSNITGNEPGNLPYGISHFSLQTMPVMTASSQLLVKASSTAANPTLMQHTPPSDSEHAIVKSISPSDFPRSFGYSAVQLPTLDQFSAYSIQSLGNGMPNADRSEDGLKLSQAIAHVPYSSLEILPPEVKASELEKAGGKQHTTEEAGTCSSSQAEGESKVTSTIFRQKETPDQQSIEGFPYEGSAIRPGVAADLKFGGSGSCPDLPWVSATGTGPHAKTISGVTYKYGKNQIKIVCACHGSHMSPEEFLQHASSDVPNAENFTFLSSFPGSNPAASATQS